MSKRNREIETSQLNEQLIALVRDKPVLYVNTKKRETKRKDDWEYISKVLSDNGFKKMTGEEKPQLDESACTAIFIKEKESVVKKTLPPSGESNNTAVSKTEEPTLLLDEISYNNEILSTWISGCHSENRDSVKLLLEAEANQINYLNQSLKQDTSINLNSTNEAILVGIAVYNASNFQQSDINKDMEFILNDDKNRTSQKTDTPFVTSWHKDSIITANVNTIDAELEYLNPSFATPVNPLPPDELLHFDEFDNDEHHSGDKFIYHCMRHSTLNEELSFEERLQEVGFIVKKMGGDGACLFRSVADQVYGNEEMHVNVRKDCMDYIESKQERFSAYIAEDFITYINRKRQNHVFGNHVEIQAISEMYNRTVKLFRYSTEPSNVFNELSETNKEPIRISYHRNNHYNSIVKVYDATTEFAPTTNSLQDSTKVRRFEVYLRVRRFEVYLRVRRFEVALRLSFLLERPSVAHAGKTAKTALASELPFSFREEIREGDRTEQLRFHYARITARRMEWETSQAGSSKRCRISGLNDENESENESILKEESAQVSYDNNGQSENVVDESGIEQNQREDESMLIEENAQVSYDNNGESENVVDESDGVESQNGVSGSEENEREDESILNEENSQVCNDNNGESENVVDESDGVESGSEQNQREDESMLIEENAQVSDDSNVESENAVDESDGMESQNGLSGSEEAVLQIPRFNLPSSDEEGNEEEETENEENGDHEEGNEVEDEETEDDENGDQEEGRNNDDEDVEDEETEDDENGDHEEGRNNDDEDVEDDESEEMNSESDPEEEEFLQHPVFQGFGGLNGLHAPLRSNGELTAIDHILMELTHTVRYNNTYDQLIRRLRILKKTYVNINVPTTKEGLWKMLGRDDSNLLYQLYCERCHELVGNGKNVERECGCEACGPNKD
ncbi:uncharacterized protein LOC127278639 [Leptopilina boulardi]|uniref:uncharacterized protein LOC127278639 n=1 Tax=Leptopilina boulardi TaxID=63433 RepID=UPI0021F5EF5F|nr:uncharacterized protein LOC127278639 [Leptopilina boulardi]